MLSSVFSRAKPRSELEQQLQEALSKDSWGVPNSLLQNIALASEVAENRQLTTQRVWQALEDKDKQWRRVFKALSLVEVLLKRGSPSVIEEIRRELCKITQWQHAHVMEGGKDVAGGIREKVCIIVDLLQDAVKLNEERRKNFEMYEKMKGVGTRPDCDRRSSGPSGGNTPRASVSRAGDSSRGAGGPKRSMTRAGKQYRSRQAVERFCVATKAPKSVARDLLVLHKGNLQAAIDEYLKEAAAKKKPGFLEMKRRCEEVQLKGNVSEQRAMTLLSEAANDAQLAINRALEEQQKNGETLRSLRPPSQSPQTRRENSPSSSSSESSSDESERVGSKRDSTLGSGSRGTNHAFSRAIPGLKGGGRGNHAAENVGNGSPWGQGSGVDNPSWGCDSSRSQNWGFDTPTWQGNGFGSPRSQAFGFSPNWQGVGNSSPSFQQAGFGSPRNWQASGFGNSRSQEVDFGSPSKHNSCNFGQSANNTFGAGYGFQESGQQRSFASSPSSNPFGGKGAGSRSCQDGSGRRDDQSRRGFDNQHPGFTQNFNKGFHDGSGYVSDKGFGAAFDRQASPSGFYGSFGGKGFASPREHPQRFGGFESKDGVWGGRRSGNAGSPRESPGCFGDASSPRGFGNAGFPRASSDFTGFSGFPRQSSDFVRC